ncbi:MULTISPECIES: flavin monoamine oxidase family protein [Pseudomonas]|uniref:Tryptophan 2-monooxygenase n=1 Tax=Pseudomonas quercus TaxID=2722792 RepID=A0ABX0YCN1_9PSED|nr:MULTISPECIES: FAD-dependent oxidoreductase [Pseudomonas]MBF7141480.1 FAD-dependent oxidoreductase [Pseudomonas sp. LY10J]NJP00019.1 FAD-dependent oxidoreductase [Pseudomonas quercus]
MTIGSSFDHPAYLGHPQLPASSWRVRYPNPPDLCFDYRRLLEQPGGVATATQPERRIAIIGAGVAGLCAARELVRAGFKQVTLIEQSLRLGGRHLTIASDKGGAPFEMGAMRLPFFNRAGEHPKEGRSLMAYYAELFGLKVSDFPNPGTPWVVQTGIYLREGCLISDTPEMLIWKNPTGDIPPPTPQLQAVQDKWLRFAKRVCAIVAEKYATPAWESFWGSMVDRYAHLSFRELVRLAPAKEGAGDSADFGGLGMDSEESRIFYSIGIGDGSWGAFYDVCCLYPLRTAIFGFSSHLQLVHGRLDTNDQLLPTPLDPQQSVTDSRGTVYEAPAWLGIAALDDSLMYLPIPETNRSLYQDLHPRRNGLLMGTKVTGIRRQPRGAILLDVTGPHQHTEILEYDEVVVTVPSWILETQMRLEGFDEVMLPHDVIDAYKHAHWESSCKVYVPLRKEFFDNERTIPQILVTDSFIHDVYAYRYSPSHTSDCLLLSYTWEDDANKLASFSDVELVNHCLAELDRILLRCSNINRTISPYVDLSGAKVQRWLTDRNSLGCARLYRAGAYGDVVRLMAYNRNHSARSRLYFAGEGYSADAGWTEPALRGAIDAVIHLCANTQATFNGSFSIEDYPRYYQPDA